MEQDVGSSFGGGSSKVILKWSTVLGANATLSAIWRERAKSSFIVYLSFITIEIVLLKTKGLGGGGDGGINSAGSFAWSGSTSLVNESGWALIGNPARMDGMVTGGGVG